MTALMNWRVWAALALAAALAFALHFSYRAGKASVRAAWDAEKVVQLNQQKEAERENRNIESARQSNVIAAQNAATRRNHALQADAASANSERQRLLDAIAAIPAADLSSNTGNASDQPAAANNLLFAECTAEVQRLAQFADGHASDVKTLIDSWPKR